MNCRDFEQTWNAQLDAREAASPGVEQALEAHAATCPPCLTLARRYLVLRQAIRAWGPPPAAPAGFADRFLGHPEVVARRPARRVVRLRPAAWTAAIAASLLVAAFAGVRLGRSRPDAPAPAVVSERTIDPQALTNALADATSATWDLARATSAPAARIGREVLDETALPGASSLPLPVEVDPTSDVLRRVSDRVHAGVAPLSGTARHAFGFLLGPAPVEDAPPPSNKGA